MRKQILKRKEKEFVGTKTITCYSCKGSGWWEDEFDQSDHDSYPCTVCNQTGKIKVKVYRNCEYYWDLDEFLEDNFKK